MPGRGSQQTAGGVAAAAAAEAGVTILAGTDSRPCGRIAAEIRGLADGAPADAVIYDADPRRDLSQLAAPRAVILRGQISYRRS